MKKRKAHKDAGQSGKLVAMPQPVAKRWQRSAVVWAPAAMLLLGALDHIWVTPALAPKLRAAYILKNARDWPGPSDHVPVVVDLAA